LTVEIWAEEPDCRVRIEPWNDEAILTTRQEFAELLGREPDATDQPPGWYRYRAARGAPFQAIRIVYEDGLWFCLVNGLSEYQGRRVAGRNDPSEIPFIILHGPFHEITEEQYMAILRDYQEAAPGSPLETPEQPVNVRQARPL